MSSLPIFNTSSIPDLPSNYTLIDIETTGLRNNKKITELGAIKVRDNQIVDEFELLVIGWEVADLDLTSSRPHPWVYHGEAYIQELVEQARAGGMAVGEGMELYRGFIGTDYIIGHNIKRFDLPTLEGFWSYMGYTLEYGSFIADSVGVVDTLELSRKRLPELNKHSVAALLTHFQHSEPEIHRALSDAKQEHLIYQWLR